MSQLISFDSMPDNVKRMIVDHMNIATKCRFKQCSKATKSLVESRPLKFNNVVFNVKTKYPNEPWHSSITTVILDDVKVGRRIREAARITEDGQLVQFVVDLLMSHNVYINKLVTNWRFPEGLIATGPIIKVNAIQIGCKDEEDVEKWLNHLAPGVEEVILDDNERFNGRTRLDMHSVIINANRLKLDRSIILTNSHLNIYHATDLNASECVDSRITLAGTHEYLKYLVYNNYPVDSKFDLCVRDDNADDMRCVMMIVGPLRYSMRKMNHGNRIHVKIFMGWGKYISIWAQMDEYAGRMFWRVAGKVCRAEHDQDETKRNWNDMPNEIKRMIVDNMDLITRTRLKMCSKSDKALVDSTPIHYHHIHISKCSDINIDGICIVQIKGNQLIVTDDTLDCIGKMCNVRRRVVYDSQEEAWRYWWMLLNRLVNNANVTAKVVIIIQCSSEFFGQGGINEYSVIKHAHYVAVKEFDIPDQDILSSNAKKLDIRMIKCPRIVNMVLKKWIDEDCVIGTMFFIIVDHEKVLSDIYEGLEHVTYKDNLNRGGYQKTRIPMPGNKIVQVRVSKRPRDWSKGRDEPRDWYVEARIIERK